MRMTGKITGKLSMTRRRFKLSGPVELGCMKRGRYEECQELCEGSRRQKDQI